MVAKKTINLNTTIMNEDFKYPKLSDFIKDLTKILEEYGDGYVQNGSDTDYTDEITCIKIYDRKNDNQCKHWYAIDY